MTPERVTRARLKRAEISRRKAMAEKLAHVLCRLDGKDPDAMYELFRWGGGRRLLKPRWQQYYTHARQQLARQGWLTET